MNSLRILIVRPWNRQKALPGSGPAEPGMQMLCIALDRDGTGSVMNRTAPLSAQGPAIPKITDHICQAIEICQPLCLFFDAGHNLSPQMLKFLEQDLKHQFPDAQMVLSTALNRADNAGFDQALGAICDYSHLKPVPGVPLIKLVEDPGFYALLVDAARQMGFNGKAAPNFIGRMRLDNALTRLWEVGKNLEYHFQKPKKMPRNTMDEIVGLVAAGGSVDTSHVRGNLEKAYLIGYAVENGVIVGDSSLKHPRKAFIDRLKRMTGLDFTGCVERGYTSVRPEYRSLGIGTRLLEGLTARAHDVGIYSVIDEKNIPAQKIAINNNTCKIAQYHSEKAGKDLGVWMPEGMAEAFLKKHQGDTAL